MDLTKLRRADLEIMKVGEIARRILTSIIENGVRNGRITKGGVGLLKTKEWSGVTFGVSYPLLSPSEFDKKRRRRYYDAVLACYGEGLS